MKKRIISILVAVSLMVCALPVVSFAAPSKISINDKAVVYTPNSDYKSGDCILTSSRNMIRRAAILRGSKQWSKITNATLRKDATIFGLLWHNFTHNADGLAFTVKCGYFKGKNERERINEFAKLIKDHPEGVVVWGKNSSIWGEHGVLLTGVKNGVPYAADSAHNLGGRNVGIEKWSSTTMYSPYRCTQYWYIKQISIGKGRKAPAKGKALAAASAGNVNIASTLKISDANKPTSLKQGSPFVITGVVESNYRIKNVSVKIFNSKGKVVISKGASPNGWVQNISAIDPYVKFGTLAAGSYTYRITATDEKKSATLVNAAFKVLPKPKSSLALKSYNAPVKIKKGDAYWLKGKITSNKKITKVTIQVVDTKGKVKLTASANNNKKSFDIRILDPKIKFGKLAKGAYSYRIIATDTTQTKTLLNKRFTVV